MNEESKEEVEEHKLTEEDKEKAKEKGSGHGDPVFIV